MKSQSSRTLLLLTGLLSCCTTAFAVNPAFENQWNAFRKQHPYHIQVVALSGPDAGNHRLLLVTEPPPHVTMQDFLQLNASVLADYEIVQTRVGYNGSVKDILVDLPPLDDSDLRLLVDRVHQYLFGTSYKAAAIPIAADAKTVSGSQYRLDLHIPAGNLQALLIRSGAPTYSGGRLLGIVCLGIFVFAMLVALVRSRSRSRFALLVISLGFLVWVIIPSQRKQDVTLFTPAEGGPTTDLRTVLEKNVTGVFFSENPGFVVWTFPRSEPLSRYAVEARQFSLDSDLIVGAVAGANEVAVIGRERVTAVGLLPPLRTETIMLLASADTDELAQSYERTNIFAGKYDEQRNLDWAPIYLSPQLINTEYGSLLNITDQLLKSWSENGEIEYVNFQYPKPASWPFPKPLIKYVNAQEITFNWNTKGVGYSVTDDGLEIFALNRTGALPVDYLAQDDQQMQKAEEEGYFYFAGQNDPNLVRVVQYAALYQIFRRFHITTGATLPAQLSVSPALKLNAQVLLSQIASIPDSLFATLAQTVRNDDDKLFLKQVEDLKETRDALVKFSGRFHENGLAALAEALAAPREQSPTFKKIYTRFANAPSEQRATIYQEMDESEKLQFQARILSRDVMKDQMILQALFRIPLTDVMHEYVGEFHRDENAWIGTPSIVISHGSDGGTGGHNLSSEISLFRASEDVPAGEIRVIEENGRRVVLHNGEDTGKVSELVRMVGKNGELKTDTELAAELQSALKNAKTIENASVQDLLGYTDIMKPSVSRGLDETMAASALERSGYSAAKGEISVEQKGLADLLAADSHRAVVVEKIQGTDNYLIFQNSTRRIFEAHDIASAQDAVRACIRRAALDDMPVRLRVRGFDARQGKGFIESTELKLGEIRPKSLTKVIDEGSLNSSELKNVLTTEYDFKNAAIQDVRTIMEDERGTLLEVESRVPALEAVKPPLIVRIQLFLEKGVTLTREALASITASIRNLLVKVGSGGDLTPAMAFVEDLQKAHPGVKVDIHWHVKENHDLYIGQNKPFQRGSRGSDATA